MVPSIHGSHLRFVRRAQGDEVTGMLIEAVIGRHGAYISVEPFHLFRYIDEQSFRFNNLNDTDDLGRFELAARNVAGKRLTYAALTNGGGTGSAASH